MKYSRELSEPDPAAVPQTALWSGQARCVLLVVQGLTLFKFPLNQESSPLFKNTLYLNKCILILWSQLSAGSSLCAAAEISREQTCWDPTAEPHPAPANTQGRAKGKIKIGKMGEKPRQRHRQGQSYGKAWSGTGRQVYDGDTAHGASQEMPYTQLGTEYFN